jgi:hypothetical protein
VSVIDFAHSYMTFFGRDEGNIARILIDAACTVTDERAGTTETFYLIVPCRSERMYLDDERLFQLPNYEFCGIFAAEECLLVRTHWVSERDGREYGRNNERFTKVELDSRQQEARELTDAAQVVQATLANQSLVARTTVRDAASGRSAVIEYPIKTMNVLRVEQRYQVDTGPILVPDFASTASRSIERFDIAHIVYHRQDTAEFILRRPQTVGAGAGAVAVTDYTEDQIVAAQNTVFAVA